VNVSSNYLVPKLLTDVVPDSTVVCITLLEHPDDAGYEETRPIEDIHARADAMTSLLKGLLAMRPAEHWGINE
jgi:hypothetical protein